MTLSRKPLPTLHTFNFHGAKMNYNVVGRGKPVILLHGSMIADPWGGFENRLGKYFQVFLPHLPGFGASEAVPGRIHNTELFSEALCAFLKNAGLATAPVIAFSLGTVVTAKAAVSGCLKGKIILVGLPGVVKSKKLQQASLIPRYIRRMIGSTVLGRAAVLVPVLKDIIGVTKSDKDAQFLEELTTTDTKSLVDIDVYKEINDAVPKLIPKIQNDTVYIYGKNDKLLQSTKGLIKNPIIIEGSGHNIFTFQPKKTLEVLRRELD